MNYTWILPDWIEQGVPASEQEVLRQILRQRGFLEQDAEEYLSEKPQRTYDPFLMKGMKEAVSLILQTVQQKGRICIYGDYDADGVTASSLLLEILGLLTENLDYYIPSRFEEGYGLNCKAVEQLAKQGTALLVTVDCGSASYTEVELAKSLGMNVIVTDHHSVQSSRADCILLNPKQADCGYPFKELCGCGVAFKLAQALQRTLESTGDQRITRKHINHVLDLAAVSTIGDIVPLQGENRTLVKHGLRALNQGKRPGLRLLIKETGLQLGQIGSEQVAFGLVPYLNAAGRMLTATTGVELLTGRGDAAALVQTLIESNNRRKRLQENTYQACLAQAAELSSRHNFLLISAEEAHEGIAGIVAGKLKDFFGKPTALVTATGGTDMLKGTGRSVEGVNLFTLLDQSRELFERFGGHAGACGFSMAPENFAALRDNLEEQMQELLDKDARLLDKRLYLDGVLPVRLITLELAKELLRMEPFGLKNEKPVFAVEEVTLFGVRYMGEFGQHARFQAKSKEGAVCDCIVFGRAQELKDVLECKGQVDLAGYPSVNVWNGRTKIQFTIRDGRIRNGRATNEKTDDGDD